MANKKNKAQRKNLAMNLRLDYLYNTAFLLAETELTTARYYIKNMVQIAQKNQIKLSPSRKRSFCKKCNTPLISGKTTHIELKTISGREFVVRHCPICDEDIKITKSSFKVEEPQIDNIVISLAENSSISQ